MGDQVSYDYDIIEKCVGLMKRTADAIADDVKGVQADVHNIMTDWEGTSAKAYDELSLDLINDLHAHNTYLEELKVKLETAASDMQGSDGDWAKKIAANR